MGEIRAQALQGLSSCCVARVYDPFFKGVFPKGVKVEQDVNAVFNAKDIDAIVICTPNHFLKEYVIKGLAAGKHVFCEKPPGRSMAELKAMMHQEKKNPRLKLMFGFNHRHHESMLHAKKLIASGAYGRVLWLRGRYGKSVDEKFFGDWRSKKELSGGGIFLDQGIHMLDLFLMFCKDFDDVHAYVSNLYWKLDIEDNVFAIFRNKQGQVASLHSTMTQWRHLFSFEIFLERGYITVNGLKTSSNSYGDEAMTIARNRSLPPAAVWTDEENITFPTDFSWQKEMAAFVSAIRKNTPVSTGSSADALKLMRLVEKVYENR